MLMPAKENLYECCILHGSKQANHRTNNSITISSNTSEYVLVTAVHFKQILCGKRRETQAFEYI